MLSARFIHSNDGDDDYDVHRVLCVHTAMPLAMKRTKRTPKEGGKERERETICSKTNYGRTGDGSTAVMVDTIPTTQQWHYVCFHHFSGQINISKLIKNFR